MLDVWSDLPLFIQSYRAESVDNFIAVSAAIVRGKSTPWAFHVPIWKKGW
jgi:hypothetical protein